MCRLQDADSCTSQRNTLLFAMGRCKKILKFVFMSEIGVFMARTVYCEITGRGCLHPSAWRQNSYAAKNPRTNVRGFWCGWKDFPAGWRTVRRTVCPGAAAPSPCSNPLRRKTKRKAPNLSSGLPFGADEGIWTHTLLRELEPESSASASSATSAYFVWPPHRRRILL